MYSIASSLMWFMVLRDESFPRNKRAAIAHYLFGQSLCFFIPRTTVPYSDFYDLNSRVISLSESDQGTGHLASYSFIVYLFLWLDLIQKKTFPFV
jgi:hypothetical protein